MPIPYGDTTFYLNTPGSDAAAGTDGVYALPNHGTGETAGFWWIKRLSDSAIIADRDTPNGWTLTVVESVTPSIIAGFGRTDYHFLLTAPSGLPVNAVGDYAEFEYVSVPGVPTVGLDVGPVSVRIIAIGEPEQLDPPEDVVVSRECCGTRILLSWSAVENALSYHIYDAATDALIETTTETEIELDDYSPYLAYSFYIIATGEEGGGGGGGDAFDPSEPSETVTTAPEAISSEVADEVAATPTGVSEVAATVSCFGENV